jgi:DNA-binding response OmpR family regulator
MTEPQSIVLIDDEILVRETVKIALGSRGFRVTLVEDSREAMDVIRREKPSLVILDLYMPDLDGLNLCRQLKADADLKGIPVLFFSGSSQTIDVISGLEAGAYDYVAKPIDGEELVAKVQAILNVHKR